MIQLGSKIILEGFETVEPAQQIVVRKMVGSLAKKVEETKGEYERLELTKAVNTVSLKVTFKDRTEEASAEHENLFFALSNAFKQITP